MKSNYLPTLFFLLALVLYQSGACNSVMNQRYNEKAGEWTDLAATPATVTTDSITDILAPSVKVWGNVTSDGGSAVTERGFVYAFTADPAVETAAKVTSGSGTGSFSASLTGLTYDQTYHVRAFAINTAGTAYGADKTFKTLKNAVIIRTEGKGNISATGGQINPNGAIRWNGREWGADGIWVHQYFISTLNGERIKPVTVIPVPAGANAWSWDTLDYKITRQPYSCSKPAKVSGTYNYLAVQYSILNKTSNKQVVLRSRGTGNSTDKPYFDIYIENADSVGKSQTITALRGDPLWFTYSGITMDQALALTSATQNLTGEFNTREGWYFLDTFNGADLGPPGFGLSYHFHTALFAATDSKVTDLGSSYPFDFALRWMDAAGNLKEFRFLPKLLSETWTPPVGIANETSAGFSMMNYPNPFSGSTTIRYELPQPGPVRLAIYTSLGEEKAIMVEGKQTAGQHSVLVVAAKLHLTPGIYFYVLKAGDRILPGKMECE
jgi:hypothetical protein